jgi:hypothetical protein
MAIALGNAPILARYLREARPVASSVLNRISFMLERAILPRKQTRTGIAKLM